MSLKNILLDVSSVLSLDISNAAEKAYHIAKINEAAEELYTANDLPGCLREQIFQIDDSDTFQVALPWYVDKIRAVRFYDNWLGKIPVEDMSPRYHSTKWGNKGLIRFRIKDLSSPLCRDLQDITPLIFSLSDVTGESADVTFNIIGRTEEKERVNEALTIVAGQYTNTTLNNYKSIEKIEKTSLNQLDCTVTDINANVVSFIPNSQLKAQYTTVMIRDDDFSPLINNSYPLNTVEVLYKTRFTPFVNTYDEFPCPKCDKIIFWKFLEHYYAYKPDMEQKAFQAHGKCKQLIKQLGEDDGLGLELVMEFGSNPMYEAQMMPRRWTTGGTFPDPLIQYTP